MVKEYMTKGVCSRMITVEVEDDIIKSVSFKGGCDGNLKGICKLAVGRRKDEVIELLKGTKCGFKNTSCPDQLARALEEF